LLYEEEVLGQEPKSLADRKRAKYLTNLLESLCTKVTASPPSLPSQEAVPFDIPVLWSTFPKQAVLP
jgi:hypothetical protein